MDEQQARIEAILDQFERSDESFHIHAVSAALHGLEQSVRKAEQVVSPSLVAELLAFDLVAGDSDPGTGWGTYYGPEMVSGAWCYPDPKLITSSVVDYWVGRARAARHPLLRSRYADLAWDLSRKAGAPRCPHDVPRIMIDATVEATTRGLSPDGVDAIRQVRRALNVAIGLPDANRVELVRDAILALEDRIGVDHLPGLWGFSFDLLIEDNPKVPLLPEQSHKIIADLEGRLARLADVADAASLEPRHVEGAALRLARFYRKANRAADMRRVLKEYVGAHLRKAAIVPALAAASCLQQVHDTLLRFDLRDEAEAMLVCYREVAQKARGELKPMSASVSLDREQVEQDLAEMTRGEWEEVFLRLVGAFLPRRDQEQKRLEEQTAGRLASLFSRTILGADGRAVAGIGSPADDPEGNLVHHVAQGMGCSSWFLRAVVDRLATRGLAIEHIAAFVFQAPIFDPTRRPIIETGLRAYLASDWLVAIHLLVPQIEGAVRRLVELVGGSTLKKGRNAGLLLRNLDELLRDERAEAILGADATFYLRVLLTDQRGWNLRNDVAHGITPPERFTVGAADRLFHALLLLGCVRVAPAETPSERAPEQEGAKHPVRPDVPGASGEA